LGPLAALAGEPRFVVTVGNEQSARRRLRGGKTDVVVIASDAAAGTSDEASGPNAAGASDAARESNAASFVYLYDFTRKESLLARNAVEDALQRAAGRRDAFTAADRNFDEPGGRYIDFLVPGLLGMSLMGGGLWGVGYVIVDMRIRKLLKRFLATPMPRSHFLAAILTSRLLFLLPEVLVLLAFARFVFGVQSQGGLAGVLVFILLGAIAFAGIGLLVASRARTLESVSGLMNLVMLPMWVLSGIFFSSDRFPAAVQPYIKLLPLTMAIDGLRGVMIDGLAAWSQPKELFGLAIWATVSFALALRLFRWN
jgi:ABC-type multidrug transport system permease subunit